MSLKTCIYKRLFTFNFQSHISDQSDFVPTYIMHAENAIKIIILLIHLSVSKIFGPLQWYSDCFYPCIKVQNLGYMAVKPV